MSESNTKSSKDSSQDIQGAGVSRVYAEALLEQAFKSNQAEEILQELESILEDVLKPRPDLESLLTGDSVSHDNKRRVIETVFTGRVNDLVCNFLNVLNDHDRLQLLRPVVQLYREKLDERRGRIQVQVSTAIPLPADQRERLIRELHQVFHREPVLDEKVNPDILGGLIVRVGDWLYDASVLKQLEKINNEISESSSHEIKNGRDRFLVG